MEYHWIIRKGGGEKSQLYRHKPLSWSIRHVFLHPQLNSVKTLISAVFWL